MYKIIINTGEVIRLSDNKVIAPAETIEDIDYQAYITWVNDGNNPTEEILENVIQPHYISTIDFRNRFTESEQIAILDEAYVGDINCRLLIFKLQTTSEFDINSQTVIDGLNYLVSINIINESRKGEILCH